MPEDRGCVHSRREERPLAMPIQVWRCHWRHSTAVPVEGVEPPRACAHLILSQARLPFRHTGASREYSVREELMSRRLRGVSPEGRSD